MPLVPAKCTQCGQNLQIDDTKEAAICPYCETPFVTEKAINTYKFEIGSVVVEGISIETKLQNAETFFKLHNDIAKARELFEEVTNLAPADWRGWWGLVHLDTSEFTLAECGSYLLERIQRNVNRALNCAKVSDQETFLSLTEKWENYVHTVNSWKNTHYDQLSSLVEKKRETTEEFTLAQNNLTSTTNEMRLAESQARMHKSSKSVPGAWAYIVSGIVSFYYGLGLIVLIPLVIRYFMLGSKAKKATARYRELSQKAAVLNEKIRNLNAEIARLDTEIKQIEHLLEFASFY